MLSRRALLSFGLILVGGALLLLTTGALSVGALVIPLSAIIAGVVLLWRAFMPDGREGNVFAGTFLALSGGFWVLRESALPGVSLSSIWPVFMTIGGTALVAYGIKKGRDYRLALLVPGTAIILLSGVFLMFSLEIVEAELSDVAVRWWPALLVLLGVFMMWSGRTADDE